MKRAVKFLLNFFLTIIVFGAILSALYYINNIFKIFDLPINQIKSQLNDVNKVFFTQLAVGLSAGTLLLLIIILIFPFFTKKINTKEYLKNIILGVIASFVFYISQTIYQYFEKFGKFYAIISIISAALITFLIVEFMSLTFNSERKEVEFRTAVLGCIASGLIFSIVLNTALLFMNYYKF
jgi:hypothetical protein